MILRYKTRTIKYCKNKKLEYLGEGVGQPLILLHGLYGNAHNWSETISYFSKSHQVIVPFLPLYEIRRSKDVATSLMIYMENLVEELGLEDFILAGNNLGGYLAVLYTLAYPDKVNRLILSGSTGLLDQNPGLTYPGRCNLPFISEKVKRLFYNADAVTEKLVEEVYYTLSDLRKSTGLLKITKAFGRNILARELPKIFTPTLLIWGQQDRIAPMESALKLRELISANVDLRVIDHCGHMPMMERPQQFNRILDNYLKGAAMRSIHIENSCEKTSLQFLKHFGFFN